MWRPPEKDPNKGIDDIARNQGHIAHNVVFWVGVVPFVLIAIVVSVLFVAYNPGFVLFVLLVGVIVALFALSNNIK